MAELSRVAGSSLFLRVALRVLAGGGGESCSIHAYLSCAARSGQTLHYSSLSASPGDGPPSLCLNVAPCGHHQNMMNSSTSSAIMCSSRLRNECCSILKRILLGGILVRSMHECCYEDGQWRTSALGGGLAERRGRAAREGVSIWSM